jgi:hypothetical protein
MCTYHLLVDFQKLVGIFYILDKIPLVLLEVGLILTIGEP